MINCPANGLPKRMLLKLFILFQEHSFLKTDNIFRSVDQS